MMQKMHFHVSILSGLLGVIHKENLMFTDTSPDQSRHVRTVKAIEGAM